MTWLAVSLFYTLIENKESLLETFYKFMYKLLDSFYLLSCSGINKKFTGSFFTLLTLAGFVYRNFYQNNIVGLTIIEDKIQPFETIAEFLNAGFRYSGNKSLTTQCPHLKIHFNDITCSDGRNHSMYNFISKKLGWLEQTRWKLWYNYEYTASFKKKFGPSLKCLYVKEELNVLQWFLVVFTNNRHWIIKNGSANERRRIYLRMEQLGF